MRGERVVKREVIVDILRREILSGELPRGTHMPQDELARRFDASITPVREALRLLEAEGLIVSAPHRGVRVAGIDAEKIKGVYVSRRLLEEYAMRRASTRLTLRDLQRLRALIDQMETEGSAADVEAYRRSNRDFHFYFYERCGLPGLVNQIAALWQAFPWDLMLSTPARSTESSHEHRCILEAIESGDLQAISEATGVHILHGFERIAERIGLENPGASDPFALDAD